MKIDVYDTYVTKKDGSQMLDQIEIFSVPVWSLAKHLTTFKIRSIKKKQKQ